MMPTDKIEFRFRNVPHNYGSALALYQKWSAGSMWGNGIVMSGDHIHVYGMWSRDFTPVWLDIKKDSVLIAVPEAAIRNRKAKPE
jgi:hypothetical protein